jgi:hypothetical protein
MGEIIVGGMVFASGFFFGVNYIKSSTTPPKRFTNPFKNNQAIIIDINEPTDVFNEPLV